MAVLPREIQCAAMRWAALLLLGVPGLARASVVDVFDLGPAMGRAGAVSATIDEGAAAYYNPGGLAFRARPGVRLGGEVIYSQLRVRKERVTLDRPFALLVDSAAPVPLNGRLRDKLAIGIALSIIPDTLLSIHSPSGSEPFLPYYQNRTQRIVVLPALAVRPYPWLGLGVGLNYFAGLSGTVRGADGANRDLQADIEEEIYSFSRVHAGLRVDLAPWRFALVYRGRFAVPYETRSSSVAADTPLNFTIVAQAFYAPETWVAGAAYSLGHLELALDLSYRRWSQYRAPFADLEAEVTQPIGGALLNVQSHYGDPQPRDVGRAALSVQSELSDDWRISAGYAFETQAVPAQSGPTNLIDGPKHIFGLGASYRLPDQGRMRWRIDAAAQAHYMVPTRLTKDAAALSDGDPDTAGRQIDNLGYPTIAGGGLAFAGTLSVVMEVVPEPAAAAGAESTP